MTVLYPDGYDGDLLTMTELKAKHRPHMHPSYAAGLFPMIEAGTGRIGIGGGYRPPGTQPDQPGFAPPGKSFHEGQRFDNGLVAYCAVDLVGYAGRHKAAWDLAAKLCPTYKLHCPIVKEPWHCQPINIRGWDAWATAGRPSPLIYIPTPTPEPEPITMKYFRVTDRPSTLWGTSDGLLAVRIEAFTAQSREITDAMIETLTPNQAEDFVYVAGLPYLSIR